MDNIQHLHVSEFWTSACISKATSQQEWYPRLRWVVFLLVHTCWKRAFTLPNSCSCTSFVHRNTTVSTLLCPQLIVMWIYTDKGSTATCIYQPAFAELKSNGVGTTGAPGASAPLFSYGLVQTSFTCLESTLKLLTTIGTVLVCRAVAMQYTDYTRVIYTVCHLAHVCNIQQCCINWRCSIISPNKQSIVFLKLMWSVLTEMSKMYTLNPTKLPHFVKWVGCPALFKARLYHNSFLHCWYATLYPHALE